MSAQDHPRKAAYKTAFNAYIFGPKMARATAGGAVALLNFASMAPADRRHRTHVLHVKVSHDDSIREPALPFKITSIRSMRNNECVDSFPWPEPEKERVRTEMAVRATSNPNQIATFFSLAASEICPALTAYSLKTLLQPESRVEVRPDWEEVARHDASDCFKDYSYESPEALTGGCRRKEAIGAFLAPHFEALTHAGISALAIYSPLESLLESYRTHALVITLRASPSFSFDKPSYRLLDAFVTSHSTATDLIKGGIGGRAAFLPDKYYEKVDPAFTGKPRDSIMFKIIVAEEGGEFRHTFGTNPIAPDAAWNTAIKRKPDSSWNETLMKLVNGGDGSSGFDLLDIGSALPSISSSSKSNSTSASASTSAPSARRLTCGGCHLTVANKGEIKKCAGCKKQAYCTIICQRKDWRRHKVECSAAA